MIQQKIYAIAFISVSLLLSLPATAHHSTITYFDPNVSVEYKALTVVAFEIVNPHTRLVFRATDDNGNEEEWTASTQSANVLRRMGIGADFVQPGDTVTVTASPHRNGSKLVLMTRMDFPNGDYAVMAIGARGGLFRAASQ